MLTCRSVALEALSDDLEVKLGKQYDTYLATWQKFDNDIQDKYDADTDHSRKPIGQADWQANYKAKIDAMLKTVGWPK